MRAWLKWSALGAVVALAALQWVPVDRSNPPVQSEIDAPDDVRTILRRSCYDCHSHETRWPWYTYVAPLSWWISDHVRHARGDLNFSEWPTDDSELQEMALRDIEEQIVKGEMPLDSYLLLHGNARLSEADRETLLEWARSGY